MFDPNVAINAVLGGQPPAAQPQAGGALPPASQALVNLMMGNLAANNANPDAVEAYREQRDAERAARAAHAAPVGPVGMGPYGQR
jgi:hypothetical protein